MRLSSRLAKSRRRLSYDWGLGRDKRILRPRPGRAASLARFYLFCNDMSFLPYFSFPFSFLEDDEATRGGGGVSGHVHVHSPV